MLDWSYFEHLIIETLFTRPGLRYLKKRTPDQGWSGGRARTHTSIGQNKGSLQYPPGDSARNQAFPSCRGDLDLVRLCQLAGSRTCIAVDGALVVDKGYFNADIK